MTKPVNADDHPGMKQNTMAAQDQRTEVIRLWPMLEPARQRQLAQSLARLLRRLRVATVHAKPADHADE